MSVKSPDHYVRLLSQFLLDSLEVDPGDVAHWSETNDVDIDELVDFANDRVKASE